VAKTITVELNDKSIDDAIKELRKYSAWVTSKENELRSRLAMLGATVASIKFSRAIYSGSNDVSVRVDDTGNTAVIYAEGESVAFIEFGTGKKHGYGHPQAGEFGFGPGTWSDSPEGKGHWDNEHGWWYGSGQHTYGSPPAMAMYSAVKEITENVTRIAKEVFAT
jgi:hypothetical protein